MPFKLRFSLRRLAAAIAILFIASYAQPTRASASFAFYYGADIPWEALGAFDVAVVEPGNVGPSGWRHRLNPGATVAAYIAVGEVHPTRPYFNRVAMLVTLVFSLRVLERKLGRLEYETFMLQ